MILSTRVKSKGEPEIFCAFPSRFLLKIFNVAALIDRRAINERSFFGACSSGKRVASGLGGDETLFSFFSGENGKKRDAGASATGRLAL